MSTAFIFPGQGSQFIGMGLSVYENFSQAAEVFAEVDEALGQNLSELVFRGDPDVLMQTENAQPALMTVSIAILRVLEEVSGKKLADHADYLAGHSLGEYTALCAAGVIPLDQTARLLKLRGQAMQDAVPSGKGAMAAVIGLDLEEVTEIAKQAARGGEACSVANDNSPGQVVISGTRPAIERAALIARDKGSKRFILLPVSAPFHCSLMQPAADRMAQALSEVTFKESSIPIVCNFTATPHSEPAQLKQLLIEQVTGMVRWQESVRLMAELGVRSFVEVGAGKVLSALVRRIDKSLQLVNITDAETLQGFMEN